MNRILLTDRHGDRWIFFISPEGDLCYRKSDDREQILQSGIRQSFDAVTDSDGKFHLTVQLDSGSLIYFTYDHKDWRRHTVLNSKSPDGVMCSFKMFILKGVPHCLYILDFKGKPMLVHHIYDMYGKQSSPRVISYTDTSKNFNACADTDGNIHIFFADRESKFKYRIYNLKNDGYTDSAVQVDDDIKTLYPVCSDEGVLHFLYTAKMKSYYALIYYNSAAKERKIISFGETNTAGICMHTNDKSIRIQWRERTKFYQCASTDGGVSFKKPTAINEVKGKTAEIIKVRFAYNPKVLNGDRFVTLAKGTVVEPPDFPQPKVTGGNHKNGKPDYNITDSQSVDEMRFLRAKAEENEKELIRLNTIINTLSDKINCLVRSSVAPPNRESTVKTTPAAEEREEINRENLELFEHTNVDDINFDSCKKF